MKLLESKFEKDMEGHIKVEAEESEDMWNLFNLIREGDRVTATTFRKINRDSGTGTDSERVKLRLKIQIDGIEYDPEGCVIRLKGKNLTENEHIKLGAFHTIELELHRAFSLEKDQWDILDVDRVKQASDPKQSADLAAVLITEGLANLCLVGANATLVRAKIEVNLPRKRGAAIAGYDKAWTKFLDAVLAAVVRHVDWSIIKCLVIAGPGFAKDAFKEHMDLQAVRQDIRPLIEHKDCIVLASASTAYKHSLKEVLEVPGIAARIKDTKASKETQAMNDFYDMLSKDTSRAFYGPGHVFAAAEIGAISVLLISDVVLRVKNVEKRRKYAQLVESVQEAGGEVHVFSSLHTSGEQLTQLSGIAAILRFPLPELEDMELNEEI